MDTVATMQEGFRIGSVLKNAFEVTKSGFVPFFLLALLMMWPQNLYSNYMMEVLTQPDPAAMQSNPELAFQRLGEVLRLVYGSMFLGSLLDGALLALMTLGCIALLSGKSVTVFDSVIVGLRRILSVVFLTVILFILFALGLNFFLIPALFVPVLFMAAVPAMIVEDLGVFASMKRSLQLTKGCRWQIFGLLLIMIVIQLGLSWIFHFLGELFDGDLHWALRAFSPVGAVYSVFSVAVCVTSYHALVAAKEGASRQQAAAVFS